MTANNVYSALSQQYASNIVITPDCHDSSTKTNSSDMTVTIFTLSVMRPVRVYLEFYKRLRAGFSQSGLRTGTTF